MAVLSAQAYHIVSVGVVEEVNPDGVGWTNLGAAAMITQTCCSTPVKRLAVRWPVFISHFAMNSPTPVRNDEDIWFLDAA